MVCAMIGQGFSAQEACQVAVSRKEMCVQCHFCWSCHVCDWWQKTKQVDGQIWQFNLDRTERVEYIDTMILHLSNTLTAFHKSYMYVRSLNALDAWDLIQRANRQACTQQWKHIETTTNKQTHKQITRLVSKNATLSRPMKNAIS